MSNSPKTINKYKQPELKDKHDIEKHECSEDDNSGCPYYSNDKDNSIKKQAERKKCTNCSK